MVWPPQRLLHFSSSLEETLSASAIKIVPVPDRLDRIIRMSVVSEGAKARLTLRPLHDLVGLSESKHGLPPRARWEAHVRS